VVREMTVEEYDTLDGWLTRYESEVKKSEASRG
jgi:hypothetical protein